MQEVKARSHVWESETRQILEASPSLIKGVNSCWERGDLEKGTPTSCGGAACMQGTELRL